MSKEIFIEDIEDKVIQWREVYVRDIDDLQKNFIHEYKPTAGDRIYIYPNSSVPRFKLKNFCDKHGVSVSKTKDKANIHVADPDSILNSITVDRRWVHHYIHKDALLGVLGRLSESMVNGLSQAVYDSPETKFALGKGFSEFLKEKLKFIFIDKDDAEEAVKEGLPVPEVNYTYAYHTLNIVAKQEEAEYINLLNSKIYHQDALNAVVSDENVIIDESLYQGFKSLLTSKNEEDHQIAMEGMANSNYRESIAYILLLFYEFGGVLSSHPSKNHINFKSLVKYLNLSPYRWNIDIDQAVNILRKKEVLTSKNMSIIMKEAKNVVIEQGETDCFKITDVVPSEEIQQVIIDTDAKLQVPAQDVIPQVEITDL